MQQKFTLGVLAKLPPSEGFSLDELVIETKRMLDDDFARVVRGQSRR